VAVMDGGRAARPTMEDVARLVGLSHQTVSRMLNDHPNVRAPTRANVRRDFGAVLATVDGIDPKDWTRRELRHSFVSMFSDSGVAIEEIARLAGHYSSRTTEVVYGKQLRPLLQTGAIVIDGIFHGNALGGRPVSE
jgi:integrase